MLTAPAVTARLTEIGWIPDYLDDLDADFRVFYGVPDMLHDLPGPKFFALAERVFAYGGVMTARADALRAAEQHTSSTHGLRAVPRGAPERPWQVTDAVTLAKDSRFAGIFSVAKVPHG
jgi:hypothetical protein